MESITDTLLVSVDLTTNGDNTVLIVGRKKPNQAVNVINAFQGEEAVELYNRLITVEKGEK